MGSSDLGDNLIDDLMSELEHGHLNHQQSQHIAAFAPTIPNMTRNIYIEPSSAIMFEPEVTTSVQPPSAKRVRKNLKDILGGGDGYQNTNTILINQQGVVVATPPPIINTYVPPSLSPQSAAVALIHSPAAHPVQAMPIADCNLAVLSGDGNRSPYLIDNSALQVVV